MNNVDRHHTSKAFMTMMKTFQDEVQEITGSDRYDAEEYAYAFVNSLHPKMISTHRSGNFRNLSREGLRYRKIYLDTIKVLYRRVEDDIMERAQERERKLMRQLTGKKKPTMVEYFCGTVAVGVLFSFAIMTAIS